MASYGPPVDGGLILLVALVLVLAKTESLPFQESVALAQTIENGVAGGACHGAWLRWSDRRILGPRFLNDISVIVHKRDIGESLDPLQPPERWP